MAEKSTRRRFNRESKSRRTVKREFFEMGLTPRQIARKHDWSTQNVYKHIAAIREREAAES